VRWLAVFRRNRQIGESSPLTAFQTEGGNQRQPRRRIETPRGSGKLAISPLRFGDDGGRSADEQRTILRPVPRSQSLNKLRMPVSTVTSHEPKRALDRRGAKQRGIYFFLGGGRPGASRFLGVRLLPLVGATESEIATAFATIVEQRAGAMLISSGAFPSEAFDQIISLAGRYALPTLFSNRDRVMSGGLASYGTTIAGLLRQMGVYAGRLLKGEKPADLPIVQPDKLELVINLKTAKALGLTIPETLLATADEVIQ